MDEVFDRVYSLTIGRNDALLENNFPPPIESSLPGAPGFRPNTDWNTSPTSVASGHALTFTELQITADIQYTKDGETNKQGTTIEVYNLDLTSQRFFRVGDTVLLRAGYRSVDGDNPPLIFSGQILKITTEKKGVNTITTLICTPSEISRKNIRFSKQPSRGETNEDVIRYFASVAAANGIPTGNIWVPAGRLISYPSGYPASGSLFPVMEKYCADNRFSCYVTLGRLYIEHKGVSNPVSPRVTVSELNIKDTIRPEDDSSETLSQADETQKPGISLTTFLNANITTATVVTVNFGEYRGDYTVTSVMHKLDLEGNSWDTIISGTRRE